LLHSLLSVLFLGRVTRVVRPSNKTGQI